jgi:16S rRNA processing protein RimM
MDYVAVAKIVNTHGYKGRIVIVYTAALPYVFTVGEALFIDMGNGKLPYFVTYYRPTKPGEAFVELDGISTKEDAKLLIKKDIFIEEKFSNKKKVFTLSDIIGYTICNKDEKLGLITDFYEMPHQNLLQFDYQGKKVLMPLHDDFVIDIDKKNKCISVDIPEGLLEI